MPGRPLVLVLCLILAVPSSAAVTGTVMNADGRAIAGARVSAYASETAAATRLRLTSESPDRAVLATGVTDAKGRFSLDTPKEHQVVSVQVEAAGYAPTMLSTEQDDEIGAIALASAGARTGRITAGGKPVAGARVLWLGMGEAVAITDAEGRYSVPDPSKWAFRVQVSHPAYARLDETVRRGSAAISPDRSLEPGVILSGRVVGPDGRTGVAGASIRVDGWPAGTSGEDGSFVLERIPSKWGAIEAHARNLAGRKVRGSDLTVRMQPAVTVSGTVRDGKTQGGVSAAHVSLAPAGRSDLPVGESAISDAKGNFSIPNVIPGSYTLMASHPGFNFQPTASAVTARDKTARTVIGTRYARVTGSVADEQKNAVSGARVVPQTVSRTDTFMPMMMMAGSQVSAVTAPDGTFVARIQPDADIQLEAQKKGQPSARSATLRLGPGERKSGVVITLPAGIPLTGRVVDREGRPVANVALAAAVAEASPAGGATRIVMATRPGREDDLVQTAADGTFSIALKPGKYDLAFRSEGFATKTVRAHDVAPGARPLEVTLEEGVEVSGRVTRGGQGIAGVSVSVFSPGAGRPEAMETDADGSFRIGNLTPGDMFLNASKRDEFIQHSRTIKAPARDIEIEIPPGGRISGRVFDKETGQPVTAFEAGLAPQRGGGMMISTGPSQGRSFTADDGTFVLENAPAGVNTLSVSAPGYTAASVPNVNVEEGRTTENVEVALERGVRVTGRVTGPGGAPLSGVSVRINSAGSRGIPRPPSFASGAVTDANGAYTLESVDSGERSFTFSRSGYVTAEKTASLSGREARIDAELTTGVRVSGTVVNEGGAPVAEASVYVVSPGGGPGGSTRTDQNGAFQMEGIAPGRYTFRAAKQGHAGAELRDVDVSSGAPIRLVFKSGGTIYGRVTGLPADEIAQAMVFASSADGTNSAPVDAMGNFRIEGAPTGTVRLRAQVGMFGGGKSSAPKSVEVAAGATVQQDIEFNTSTMIRGRVTRDGRPVAGAMVAFSPREAQAQTSARTQADNQGYYEVNGLDDATYNVFVSDMQRGGYSTTYQVRGSGTFDIAMRSSTVRGRVIDGSSNQPVAQATVELRQSDTGGIRFPMAMVQSDAAGAFTLQDVGAGSYQLSAEKDGYGTQVVDLQVGESPRDVEVKLTPNAGVTLRVVDARDGRVLSAFVRVFDMQDRIVYESPMRFGGGAGEAIKLGMEPGNYRAVISVWGGYASQNIRLTSPGSLTVGMTPGGTIAIRSKGSEIRRGRLIGADGREYQRGMGTSSIFTIDPSPGVTQLDNIAPGVYTLQILGTRGEVTASAQISVMEGGRSELDL